MTKNPTVLVADNIAQEGMELMRSNGIKLVAEQGLTDAKLARLLCKVDGVVVRSATQIRAKVLSSRSTIKVIGRAGIGVDNIDVPCASELGIVVINTPDANAVTTAELVIAHIFSLARHLTVADASVRVGKWERGKLIGTEISGKAVGIIGFGTIGRLVAVRCRALGLNVFIHDPFVAESVIVNDGYMPATLPMLLKQADFVTVHTPGSPQTMGLIGAAELKRMKKKAYLIQCARGGIVDEKALAASLKAGAIAGAAVDVFTSEPVTKSNPLLKAPNITFTPHLGASTAEAQKATGVAIAKQLVTFFATGEAVSAVNMMRIPADLLDIAKPYIALARCLGGLLRATSDTNPEQLDITLHGHAVDVPEHILSAEMLAGMLGPRLSMQVNIINAQALAERQGIKVSISKVQAARDFTSLIEARIRCGKRTHSLAGTLLGGKQPLLVRFENFELEAPLTGHLLFTIHKDRPGVIAELTSILAAKRINITHMHVASAATGKQAASCLRLGIGLSDAMLRQIASLDAVKSALQLQV